MKTRIAGIVFALVVIAATLSPADAAGHRVFALRPGNALVHFDSQTPTIVTSVGTVTGIGANETIRGIDFRPRTGQLYATTVTTGASANSVLKSYVVDPLTATATLVGSTEVGIAGAADLPSGYDFNPTVDRIRYGNTNDENLRLNPNNASLAGNDTDLTPAATTTIIASAYDRNFDRQTVLSPPNNVIPTTLWTIDRNDSQVGIQGGIDGNPTPNGGVVTDLGPLGFTLNQANDGGFDIVPGIESVALAALTDAADNLTRLYTIDLTPSVDSSPRAQAIGLIGNGQTEVRSIAIVPDRIVAVGADGKATPQVRTFGPDGRRLEISPYIPKFKGGVRVAVGDVNGDGVYDVVTGSGRKQVAHVRVFDGATGLALTSALGSFVPFEPTFTGGVFVAAGDVNGDGFDDIVVAPDVGAAPQVRAFDGRTGVQLKSFFAYGDDFRGGVRVATADVNNDGLAEIITATGPGAGPQVKVFSGADNSLLFSFFAFDAAFQGGVHVAGGDVNGDGRADVVTGAGPGGGPHVRVFSGANAAVLADFQASQDRARGGVRVAATDVNRDGRPDIVVGFGPSAGSEVRAFDGRTLLLLQSFFAFEKGPKGVFVGG